MSGQHNRLPVAIADLILDEHTKGHEWPEAVVGEWEEASQDYIWSTRCPKTCRCQRKEPGEIPT